MVKRHLHIYIQLDSEAESSSSPHWFRHICVEESSRMYYASLVAYHIFFNSTKYLYFLLLLISSLLYIFVFAEEMGKIKEWALCIHQLLLMMETALSGNFYILHKSLLPIVPTILISISQLRFHLFLTSTNYLLTSCLIFICKIWVGVI